MATNALLHVVFGMSAAGSLKQAIAMAGRDERVIGLPDDLSFGPVNPPDPVVRAAWVDRALIFETESVGQWAVGIEPFWGEAVTWQGPSVAWVCRHSASEYAGFLEWVWRQGEHECHVIDVTGLVIQVQPRGEASRSVKIGSFGQVHPKHIVDQCLWDRKRPLTVDERRDYRAEWARLRAENAPLRVIEADRLVSAPIGHFDPLIMSYVTHDWRKAARVVGDVLGGQTYHQIGEIVVIARLWALVEARRLEVRGEIGNVRRSDVRIAQGLQTTTVA